MAPPDAARGDDREFALAVLEHDERLQQSARAAIEAASSCSPASVAAILRTLSSETTSLPRGIDVMSVMKFSFGLRFQTLHPQAARTSAPSPARGNGQHGTSERAAVDGARGPCCVGLKTRRRTLIENRDGMMVVVAGVVVVMVVMVIVAVIAAWR